MITSIKRLAETVEVSGVESVVVSDVVDDGAGGFVRAITVKGPDDAPIFTLRVQGATEDALEITTPNLTF